MKIQATEIREVSETFESAMTLENFKSFAAQADDRDAKSKGIYIEPQTDWYNPELSKIVPLGIQDWIEKHNFWNWRFVSVAARMHHASTKRVTEGGEVLGTGPGGSSLRVHYIDITSDTRGGVKTMKVEVMMADNRKAIITESYAQHLRGDEVTNMWVKVIKDGAYAWFKVKTVDQPYQPVPSGIILAAIKENLRWPSILANVLIYRDLRRQLAPRYEYNLYRTDKDTVKLSEEERKLEMRIGNLNKVLDKLFQLYKNTYGIVPLSFVPLYDSLRQTAQESAQLAEDDHVGRTGLVSFCVESVENIMKHEGALLAVKKAHSRSVREILESGDPATVLTHFATK